MRIDTFNTKIETEDSGLFKALRELTGKKVSSWVASVSEWQPWHRLELSKVRS